jgi:DNA-binding XRE family transcriptional regulator
MAESSPETLQENWYGADVATFGDRLAGAREAAGLSQEDLAQRLGVRLTTLQNWEEDLAEPRGNRLQATGLTPPTPLRKRLPRPLRRLSRIFGGCIRGRWRLPMTWRRWKRISGRRCGLRRKASVVG